MAVHKLALFHGIADVGGALNQVASVSEPERPAWFHFQNHNKLGFLIGILTHAPNQAMRDEYATKFYWIFGSEQLPGPNTQEEMDCLNSLHSHFIEPIKQHGPIGSSSSTVSSPSTPGRESFVMDPAYSSLN
ncbi:hypothetical protein BJ741DRAFT_670441 [Chytriomyces cf. hyalinus JEL632]|nr:hypothetical protein BJ741DRAFT_670441 [Chytriomyces cf. hyalinus JEL632]